MLKKIIVSIGILLISISNIYSQDSLKTKKYRFMTGVACYGYIGRWLDSDEGLMGLGTSPRFGMYLNNHFLLGISMNTEHSKIWGEKGVAFYRIVTGSPFMRYYFWKRNLLLTEICYNYGQFRRFGDKVETTTINSIGLGIGGNIFFRKPFLKGKLSIEIVLKKHFNLNLKPGPFRFPADGKMGLIYHF